MDYKDNFSEYKKDRDERLRESWRAARQSNDYSGRNLNFLIQAMRSLKLTPAAMAKLTGNTPQMINWWFVSDDCRYSTLRESFAKMNIELDCMLQELPDSPFVGCKSLDAQVFTGGENSVVFTLRLNDTFIDLSESQKSSQSILDSLDDSSNMKFLADFIKSHGLNIYSFSRMVSFEYPTMYGFFSRDDIRISRLMEIARNGKLQVNFSLRNMEAAQPQSGGQD